MQAAVEPGLRLPSRSEQGPAEIVRDFMGDRRFDRKRILELGPGHFEFCELVRERGGDAVAFEFDPAVVRLGASRGFSVECLDFRELVNYRPPERFDGLFCKGSSNPLWFYDDSAALEKYIDGVTSLVAQDGWIWFVSCPWKPGISEEQFNKWLDVEEKIFRSKGYNVWSIPHRTIAAFYGISVPCRGLRVYLLRLPAWNFGLGSTLSIMRLAAVRSVARVNSWVAR